MKMSAIDMLIAIVGAALIMTGACWGEVHWCAYTKVQLWKRITAYALLFVGVVILLFGATGARAQTIQVPDVDARIRLLVEQAAADEWGVNASPARLAAQLHQESSWNPRARSSVGAEGLAQMMPTTGKWLAQQFPQIGAYDPWDAAWSARAAAVYDHWLLQRNQGAGSCSSWAFAFSAYNGGETLLHKEQTLASQHGRDAKRWFGNTENYSARAQANWRQNRDYVRRILIVLEPAYIRAGWTGTAVCV
jgi:soluble lytic murein transglycosylase-like protein